MTATLNRPSIASNETIEPGTTLRRRAAGAAFLGAAAITMAGILATPFENGSSESAYLKSLADHPKQAMVAAVLLHFGYLLFVPAAFAMARLARRGARKLSSIGIVLAVLGSGLSGLLVTDLYDLSIAQHAGVTGGVPISNMDGVPLAGLGFLTMGLLTSLGMTVGLALLAAAMWRARLAPVWPAIAIVAGFTVSFGAHSLLRTAIGFAATCVAIAFLGITVLRMGDDRFAYGSDAR
jgi:hypothetical protein